MYALSAYFNSKTMQKTAASMSSAAQKATNRAFLAEISASLLMFVMPSIALVIGGAILNFVNLGLGVISFSGVMTMLYLESAAW